MVTRTAILAWMRKIVRSQVRNRIKKRTTQCQRVTIGCIIAITIDVYQTGGNAMVRFETGTVYSQMSMYLDMDIELKTLIYFQVLTIVAMNQMKKVALE